MAITDFMDLSLLEQVLEDWTISTGMSAVAIDKDEHYITKEFGYTDFYEKYHRSAADDLRRHIGRNDSDISWFIQWSDLLHRTDSGGRQLCRQDHCRSVPGRRAG